MMNAVSKKTVTTLFLNFNSNAKSRASSIINTCEDDFMRLLLSILFKIPIVSRYHGLRKSPAILKHVIRLIFGLEIEISFMVPETKEISRIDILELLIKLEEMDPDIIDVDRSFVKFIIEGQKIAKAGRIYFELFRDKVKGLDFYTSCKKLRGQNINKLIQSAKLNHNDFSILTKYYPEILTYYSIIDKRRYNLFKKDGDFLILNYKELIKRGYRTIRTYTTAYSIITRNKQLETRANIAKCLKGRLLYKTLNSFIIEAPEIVEYMLDFDRLSEVIENVPSFYVAFDVILNRALEDMKYLGFVGQILKKYPVKSSIEKAKCLRSKYPDFVKNIEKYFN